MPTDTEEFFAGGVTSASFPDREYGTTVGGEVVNDPVLRQQRDYTTGDPITYPDGNPAMQLIVHVQTDQRDPEKPDDDGVRALYIRGQLKKAVGDALRKVGAKSVTRGGRLLVTYDHDEPTTLKNGRPGNPQKIYVAKYEPPTARAAADFLAGPTQAPATTEGGGLACPAGVDPSKWAAMTPTQQTQMYDALGLAVPQAQARQAEIPF